MKATYSEDVIGLIEWKDDKGNDIQASFDSFEVFKYVKMPNFKRVSFDQCCIYLEFNKAVINGTKILDAFNGGKSLILLDEKDDGLYMRVVSELEMRMEVDEEDIEKQGISYKLPEDFEQWYKKQLKKGAKAIEAMIEEEYEMFIENDGRVNILVLINLDEMDNKKAMLSIKDSAICYHPLFKEIQADFEAIFEEKGDSILQDFVVENESRIDDMGICEYSMRISEIRNKIQGLRIKI